MTTLRTKAAVVCIVLLSSMILIPFTNADWIMFHSDPTHSGAGTDNPSLTTNLLWKYKTGSKVDSSPTVANGIVYVGSDDGNVYALNADSGTKIWNYATGGAIASTPAVDNGVVFVGSDDHNVYALNATSAFNFGFTPPVGGLHPLLRFLMELFTWALMMVACTL